MTLQSPKQYLLSGHNPLIHARPHANVCKRIEFFSLMQTKRLQTCAKTEIIFTRKSIMVEKNGGGGFLLIAMLV